MAQYYFSRDVKVYAHVPLATAGTLNMFYELPVLDGFSFSQATNASEITLNQAQDVDGNSIRGRQMFNDSYAPAEFSFSTYMAPYTHNEAGSSDTIGTTGSACSTDNAHCEVSEALWAMFFSQTVDGGRTAATGNTGLTIDMNESNKVTIGVFDLYFVFGGAKVAATSTSDTTPGANYAVGDQMIYRIKNCSMNEASIDFDLDGLATVAWSGMGKIITEESGLNFFSGTQALTDGTTLTTASQTALITEGVGNTTGFIRNRLSDLTINPTDTSLKGDGNDYIATLTGGNITFSNNLTYLTPETLGVVNQPLGHVTGTRTIGGNFTCYLDNDTAGSAELFEDLIESTTDIQNSVSLSFDIGAGGAVATGAPSCLITMATCHLEVPTHSIDDVISLETNFHALPSTVSGTDEVSTFEFYGKDVNA